MYKYKMIMKKILSALGIIAMCLCSCNNNITNPEVDEPNNETKTETFTSGIENGYLNLDIWGDVEYEVSIVPVN